MFGFESNGTGNWRDFSSHQRGHFLGILLVGCIFFLLLLRFFFGSFFYFFSPATEKMGRKNRRGSSRRPSINGRVSLEVAFLPRRFNVLGSTIRPQIARCKNPVKLGNTRSLLTKTDPTNTIQETCQKKI